MADLSQYLDCSELTFWFAAACIIFNPLFWNAVARWEYRTHIISRLFGSPYLGCYSLGAVIISLALYRSHCFSEAMSFQPQAEFLKRPAIYYIGAALVAMGGVLVISSFLALGFVGTYLGTPAPRVLSLQRWSPLATKSPLHLKARSQRRFTGPKKNQSNKRKRHPHRRRHSNTLALFHLHIHHFIATSSLGEERSESLI
ncbi:phosphatidylethanolamine N-methyltransferase isoform 1-T1 [Mantella aurantiaca]